jgi:hypothetical protein
MKAATDLRRRALRLERRGRAMLAQAAKFRGLANQIEAAERSYALDAEDLTTDSIDSTMVSVESTEKSLNVGRVKSLALKSGHPFAKALYDRGLTMAAWASKHKVSVSSAASWVAQGKSARKVPRRWAVRIEAELGLPADETTWTNGIYR